MRYSSTENIGLLKTGLAFEQCLGWVSRPQPISDVGIDMHVEEVIAGDPTGRFLLVQVKSGRGNVHESSLAFSYYMRQVHYKYYLHANLPVIFSLYLPEEDRVFWAPVEASHVRRTESRWRLDIPKTSILDATAERRLQKLLDGYGRIGIIDTPNHEAAESLEELLEDWSLVKECALNITSIAALYSDCSARLTSLNERLGQYLDQGLDDTTAPVRNGIREFASILTTLAAKSQVEMNLFSDNFAISYSAMSTVIRMKPFRPIIHSSLVKIEEESENMLTAIDQFVDALRGHLQAFEKTTKKYTPLKTSTSKAIVSTENSIAELIAARAIVVELITIIKDSK